MTFRLSFANPETTGTAPLTRRCKYAPPHSATSATSPPQTTASARRTPFNRIAGPLPDRPAFGTRARAYILFNIKYFRALSTQGQERKLPALYLLLEKYLIEIDPHKNLTASNCAP